ncbi:AraC-like ligand-binding domain-containing protein [Variovorax gossypii]
MNGSNESRTRSGEDAASLSDHEWSTLVAKEFIPGDFKRTSPGSGGSFCVREMSNGGKFADICVAGARIQHDIEDVNALEEDALLVFVAHRGGGRVIQGNEAFDFQEGDIVFRRARLPSEAIFDVPSRLSFLSIPASELKANLPAPLHLEPVLFRSTAALTDIVQRTANLLGGRLRHPKNCVAGTLERALVQLTLSMYMEHAVQTDRLTPAEVLWQQCMHYIDTNLCEPDLRAERCAEALGISLRYFFRLFELHGLRFRSYVQEQRLVRVCQAMERAAGKRLNLASIAFQNGSTMPRISARRSGRDTVSHRANS